MNFYKITILSLIALFLSGIILADEEIDSGEGVWKTSADFSLNASQTSFTDWAAGGDNSISGNSFFSFNANYKKDKMSWENSVDLGIGYMKQGKNDFFKNDDRIAISSKYGRTAFENWHYSSLVSFRTQFTEGFKSIAEDSIKVSDFLAPGYLTVSIGMDYKPNDDLTILISPLAGRSTFVMDDDLSALGSFGVKKGKNVRHEFGGFLKIQYKWDIMENINLRSNLELFSNYLEDPQNVNLNWENIFRLKINSYISANIHLTMIYDDNVKVSYDSTGDGINDSFGPRLQIRNIMGIGFSYKFTN